MRLTHFTGGAPAHCSPGRFTPGGLLMALALTFFASPAIPVCAASPAADSSPLSLAVSFTNGDVCVYDWNAKRLEWEGGGDKVLRQSDGGSLGIGADGGIILSSFDANAIFRLDSGDAPAVLKPLAQSMSTGGAGAVSVGPDGRIYVCGRKEDCVIRVDATTGAMARLPERGFLVDAPMDLAFGPDGLLYVASGHGDKVARMEPEPGAVPEAFVRCGNGGLRKIAAIEFGPDDDLYVCCQEGDVVRRFDGESGAFVKAVVMEDAELFDPLDLAVSPDGDLFVSYRAPQVVVRYDAATGAVKERLTFCAPGGFGRGFPVSIAFLPGAVRPADDAERRIASAPNRK